MSEISLFGVDRQSPVTKLKGPLSICETLSDELEAELRSVISLWFPRSVDREHGGFFCDFDHRWKPRGSQLKMLEYQARQTTAAARAAAHYPEVALLRDAAAHGFRYLNEKMWDRGLGGWYRLLDQTGEPLEGSTKHGHGISYAISACVACYELSGNAECLELAKLTFAWLEEHAYDSRHGGYFVFYQRDGTPILSVDQCPIPGQSRDAIGTPIGFKDANTTSDLIKSFVDLHRVWPDVLLRKRLGELLSIVRDRLVVAPGVMHFYTHLDWKPIPEFAHYGQILRSAIYLVMGSETLHGTLDPITKQAATAMADTMLRIAWDSNKGGFHFAGSSFGPIYLEDTLVFVPTKSWWPQADGMKLLLTMARIHPDDAAKYELHFVRLWDYVKKYLIDAKHGGWRAAGIDTNPGARRGPKATVWKDSSHEVEALLDSLLILNSL